MITKILSLVLLASISSAKVWTLTECRGQMATSPEKRFFDARVSLQFSDVTGNGSGSVRLNKSAPIAMTCGFMNEARYGIIIGSHNQNKWILCETVVPVMKNQKLGLPFNSGDFGFPFNLSTYLQLEDGNKGHGTLNADGCNH